MLEICCLRDCRHRRCGYQLRSIWCCVLLVLLLWWLLLLFRVYFGGSRILKPHYMLVVSKLNYMMLLLGEASMQNWGVSQLTRVLTSSHTEMHFLCCRDCSGWQYCQHCSGPHSDFHIKTWCEWGCRCDCPVTVSAHCKLAGECLVIELSNEALRVEHLWIVTLFEFLQVCYSSPAPMDTEPAGNFVTSATGGLKIQAVSEIWYGVFGSLVKFWGWGWLFLEECMLESHECGPPFSSVDFKVEVFCLHL